MTKFNLNNSNNYSLLNNKFNQFFNSNPQTDVHVHAVMLFNNFDNNPYNWINTDNVFFTNGCQALNFYAETPNHASQLISAESKSQLLTKMKKMINNFNNNKWLDKHLLPYI